MAFLLLRWHVCVGGHVHVLCMTLSSVLIQWVMTAKLSVCVRAYVCVCETGEAGRYFTYMCDCIESSWICFMYVYQGRQKV